MRIFGVITNAKEKARSGICLCSFSLPGAGSWWVVAVVAGGFLTEVLKRLAEHRLNKIESANFAES